MLTFSALLDMLIVGLAAYRLALMIATETGPSAIFERLRGEVAKRFPGVLLSQKHDLYRQHWITEGVNCPLCVGFWLVPMLGLLWITGLGFLQLLVVWLAVAGFQTLLTKISG